MNNVLFAFIYLIIDIMWITIMSRYFYQNKFTKVQYGNKMTVKFVPAVMAYMTLLVVLFFITIPLSDQYKDKYPRWFVFGAVGFCVYGVYNFTNGAILNHYDNQLMIVDTLWGTLSFGFLGFLYTKL